MAQIIEYHAREWMALFWIESVLGDCECELGRFDYGNASGVSIKGADRNAIVWLDTCIMGRRRGHGVFNEFNDDSEPYVERNKYYDSRSFLRLDCAIEQVAEYIYGGKKCESKFVWIEI